VVRTAKGTPRFGEQSSYVVGVAAAPGAATLEAVADGPVDEHSMHGGAAHAEEGRYFSRSEPFTGVEPSFHRGEVVGHLAP
jgi:hypothetical protein